VILHADRAHSDTQEQTERVDENVSIAASDLLARIFTCTETVESSSVRCLVRRRPEACEQRVGEAGAKNVRKRPEPHCQAAEGGYGSQVSQANFG
jgi:hypothetical protein